MPIQVNPSEAAEWRRVIKAIDSNAALWQAQRDAIVSVRPGFHRINGALTRQKSIVVETQPAESRRAKIDRLGLPEDVNGIPVDVQPMDPRERALGEDSLADWRRVYEPDTVPEATRQPPEIGYVPPSAPLERREVDNVLCHIGPDAGWTTLSEFLSGVQNRLSVSMYELTADHVVAKLEEMGGTQQLGFEMVLQENGDETETIEALEKIWADRFTYAPAVVSGPNRIFANSYHTKVAVRDGKAFWLSSGNWSPHSQPIVPPEDRAPYRLGNREWHVVIADEPLSKTFETYVRWDRARAAEQGEPETTQIMPELLVPESALLELEAGVLQTPFPPKRIKRNSGDPRIAVQPLMTPDNYGPAILSLIKGATKSLWMQYAYIREPSYSGILEELVAAVASKMANDAIDVRVIVDGRNQLPKHIDFLLGAGWDPAKFRKQRSKVHNKGIIVDGRRTVVGSQNWSSDGVEFNRDASVIIDDTEIAEYFGGVFDFDWKNLTKEIETAEITPIVAEAGAPTPPGMVRIPWRSWYAE